MDARLLPKQDSDQGKCFRTIALHRPNVSASTPVMTMPSRSLIAHAPISLFNFSKRCSSAPTELTEDGETNTFPKFFSSGPLWCESDEPPDEVKD